MPLSSREILLCPVCGATVGAQPDLLTCSSGHRFDAARQGYFNLLTGRGTRFEADTAGMVGAREDFLSAGHYEPLRSALADAAVRLAPRSSTIVDAGAGTGYYLRAVADRFPGAFPVALDISKFALRRAARRLPDGVSLVWDVWKQLPLQSRSVDLLLNIFAPRNPAEFFRVLGPNGLLLVATPQPGHLVELREQAVLLQVPDGKAEDVARSLAGSLKEIERNSLEYQMDLSPAAVKSAILMGPAARHYGPGQLDAVMERLEGHQLVSAAFTVQAFVQA
ncbi:putative RNA methyltransferase [Arthrobacter sp. H41]|uniref:putative RNA methyltransferase n=1 Tax=Arthrobacter sp. H41 TaxID=1312978 RepID=UPI000479B170|nr:methyltransferase domain-containing protein [Arthrobacter sp. H41]